MTHSFIKWCPTCETHKSSDEFDRHKGRKDGRYYQCKECRKQPEINYDYWRGEAPMITAEKHNKILLARLAEWDEREGKLIREITDLRSVLSYYISEHGTDIPEEHIKEIIISLGY